MFAGAFTLCWLAMAAHPDALALLAGLLFELSAHVRAHLEICVTLMAMLIVCRVADACTLLATVAVPYFVLFICNGLVAICVTIYNVNQVSYRQALVDARLQGRMNATVRSFV